MKFSYIFLIALVALALIFGANAISPIRAASQVSPERSLGLRTRIETLKTTYDAIEHLKTVPVANIASEMQRLQTEWSNEAESHRRELAGVQTDYQGK